MFWRRVRDRPGCFHAPPEAKQRGKHNAVRRQAGPQWNTFENADACEAFDSIETNGYAHPSRLTVLKAERDSIDSPKRYINSPVELTAILDVRAVMMSSKYLR